jgi:hypothetical protein
MRVKTDKTAVLREGAQFNKDEEGTVKRWVNKITL